MAQRIQFSSDGFTMLLSPHFPRLKKNSYIVYSMKYKDITGIIHVTEKSYLLISGDFIVEKYRFRCLGKLPWNYSKEKRMVSRFPISLQLNIWPYLRKISQCSGCHITQI
jgi:hypothetical protein